MTRRSFIKLIAATATVVAMPMVGATTHSIQNFTLYGDGVTDDTEAIQALFDCKEVFMNGKALKPRDGVIYIPSGTFSIKTRITI